MRETAGRQTDTDKDRQTDEFLVSLSVQSLDWETFEQYCAWQLFLAHNIPLETVIPILQHLKYKGEWNHRLWRRVGEAFRLPENAFSLLLPSKTCCALQVALQAFSEQRTRPRSCSEA